MKIQIPAFAFFASFGLIFLSQPYTTSGLPTPTADEMTISEQATNSLKALIDKGTAIPKEIISNVGDFFKNLERKISFAREKIEELEEFCKEKEIQEFNLTSSYWNEYYPIRTNLRHTRQQLRSLARKTVKFANETEAYFNSDLADKEKLEFTMKNLKAFVKKSAEILGKAKIEYESALDKMEEFLPKFRQFKIEMTKLTKFEDASFKKWEADIRGGVYGGTAGGSVACGFADIALLGMCSAIYNSIAWPAAIASVEATIASYKAQFNKAQRLGVRLVDSFDEVKGQLDQSIKFLEQELDIINDWEEVVDNAEKNIELIPVDKVPTLSQIFINDIADMKRVAKTFLQRPVAVFGNDAPQAGVPPQDGNLV